MFGLVKFLFWGLCSFVLNVVLFMTFGAILAFLILAFSADVPQTVKSTSPILGDFLNSSEKSKEFTLTELNEGVFNIILDCAREQSRSEQRSISAPVPPTLSISEKKLQLCIPFSAKIFSKNVKLGAFVILSFNGDEIAVEQVYIGDARVPDFIAENIAESLFYFYSPIKSLEKYFDILEDCKVEITSDSKVRIVK